MISNGDVESEDGTFSDSDGVIGMMSSVSEPESALVGASGEGCEGALEVSAFNKAHKTFEQMSSRCRGLCDQETQQGNQMVGLNNVNQGTNMIKAKKI